MSERECMEFDVLIVGAGLSGFAEPDGSRAQDDLFAR